MTKNIVKEQPSVLEAEKILKKGIKNKSIVIITACFKCLIISSMKTMKL
jgi:hypothetical protein